MDALHESDIMVELDRFFKKDDIKCEHQYRVKKNNKTYYYIDCYLPDYNIAIEIDEKGHKDRNQKYETDREKFIKEKLGCKMLRCDPNNPKFSLMGFLGELAKEITIRALTMK
jgi:very-short-patch-repair endonuclease